MDKQKLKEITTELKKVNRVVKVETNPQKDRIIILMGTPKGKIINIHEVNDFLKIIESLTGFIDVVYLDVREDWFSVILK